MRHLINAKNARTFQLAFKNSNYFFQDNITHDKTVVLLIKIRTCVAPRGITVLI